MRSEPRVSLMCQGCYRWREYRVSALPPEHACEKCGLKAPVSVEGRRADSGAVKMCFACGCGHLYVEKDFSRTVGCLVIVVAAALFLAFSQSQGAIFILLGAALVDAVVYWLVGRRTICYRCLAEYRGFPLNPEHGAYELGVASRYSDDDRKKGSEPRDQA